MKIRERLSNYWENRTPGEKTSDVFTVLMLVWVGNATREVAMLTVNSSKFAAEMTAQQTAELTVLLSALTLGILVLVISHIFVTHGNAIVQKLVDSIYGEEN